MSLRYLITISIVNRTALVLLTILVSAGISLMIYYGFVFDGRSASRAEWRDHEAILGQLNSKLQELANQIQSFQGASKCDGDSQCRIVGLGTRVCGDYKDFLIYSTKDSYEPNLLKLIAEFNKSHEKIVGMTLSVNSCGRKPASIRCVEQRCVPDIN
jgi:hypothetical protein